MYKRQRQSRQSLHLQHFDDLDGYGLDLPARQPSRILQNLPMLVVGAMLVAAFAFAGNLIGRNASAHNAANEELASLAGTTGMMSPTSDITTKGSLLPEGENFTTINVETLRRQTIADGKVDLEP